MAAAKLILWVCSPIGESGRLSKIRVIGMQSPGKKPIRIGRNTENSDGIGIKTIQIPLFENHSFLLGNNCPIMDGQLPKDILKAQKAEWK
jgi:hypothetical protein